MIPSIQEFVRRKNSGSMKMETLQNSTLPTPAIQSIAFLGRGEWLVTLDVLAADSWIKGMSTTLASTTNGSHDGRFKIVGINFTNKTLTIKNINVSSDKAQAGAAGTATPDGIIPVNNAKTAQEFLNDNEGGLFAWKYTTAGKFLYYCDADHLAIQILKTEGTSFDYTIKQSLEPVLGYFTDFSTAISGSGSTNDLITFKDECKGKWILIDVTAVNGSAEYIIFVR